VKERGQLCQSVKFMIPGYHTRGSNRRIYLLLIFAHYSTLNCALHWAKGRIFFRTWKALLVDHSVISLETDLKCKYIHGSWKRG
jgi:hypothetical protein